MSSKLRAGAVLAVMVLSAATGHAQPRPTPTEQGEGESLFGREPAGPSRPTPRLPDGHPDFTGYWKGLKEAGKPGGNLAKDQPGFRLPYSPAGEAALKHNLTKTIDPEALCILGGIPRHNGSALPFEVLHTPRRLAFLYLYNTHRFVPIDGRKHDPDPDPRYFGNATASWDGDTLVIDTVGFKDSKDGKLWLDENANPQSEKTHVVERWTRPDADHIRLEMRVDDLVYYTRPFDFSRTWVLGKPGDGLSEYACNENNIDAAHLQPGPGAIGPDGNRGYGTPKLPDEPPSPEFYEKR